MVRRWIRLLRCLFVWGGLSLLAIPTLFAQEAVLEFPIRPFNVDVMLRQQTFAPDDREIGVQAAHLNPDRRVETGHALDGLTIAVQEGTSAHHYAEANLSANRLLVCDSLPAALEHADSQAVPAIDVILGAQPVLEYMVTRVRKDWALLTRDNGAPLLLTKGNYAVAMAEESYRLRWLVNDLLLKMGYSL